jgi:hypothetical protein
MAPSMCYIQTCDMRADRKLIPDISTFYSPTSLGSIALIGLYVFVYGFCVIVG